MHASHLAELAGWLTIGSVQEFKTEELSNLLSDRYWAQSKARTERWNKALRMFADDLERDDDQHNPWPAISIVAEEIILSEMLTRVWSAVITQKTSKDRQSEFASIAHSILIGHVEARNRAFRILLEIPHWAKPTAEKLNQLGKTIERWTDLLLSQLNDLDAAATFAFCEKRLRDFAGDGNSQQHETDRQSGQLLLASLTADLRRLSGKFPANPELNRQVAAGIFACFVSDPFASSSLPKSAWMMQVDSFHHNAEDLIQQLFASEEATENPADRIFSIN